jgi:hypothetical protein
MKAPEIRRLSLAHDKATLDAAAAALMAGDEPAIRVEGDPEDGERLTHVMLAQRVLDRVAAGLPHAAAYREVMGAVRVVLTDSD